MTQQELKQIFQNPYQRKSWLEVLNNVFSRVDVFAQPQDLFNDVDSVIEGFQIGIIQLTDDKNIAIFEVEVSDNISILHNRKGLRDIAAKQIDQSIIHGALVFFYSQCQSEYRFTFIAKHTEFDDEGNLNKIQTHPKRYTYVLGTPYCGTAVQRISSLAGKNQLTPLIIKDVIEAFSVEALTKEFYSELSNWYFWALQNVKFPNDFEQDEEVRNATSTIRLITRLMFVWFLKQKGLIPDGLFDKEELKKILNYSDKTGSTFYKAILQNLFFATLNTEMSGDKRKFINRQYGVQGFYRYERFFSNKERFLELTKDIPFLNGGLFENLDKNVGETNEIRIDCFSNKVANENRLSVPDYLFFDGAEHADLNRAFGDSNHGNTKVRGLIEILKSYNFTIEENTPYEIEVALDPELLGKVFENLLASYNPETKTTARKQTGSFYTPREIVNYMVDESILAYLKNKLLEEAAGVAVIGNPQIEIFGNETRKGQLSLEQKINSSNWVGKETELEDNLRLILAYNGDENPFDAKDTALLIKAIDNCKILDPACGSGAFPMGVLQKMVHILQKLDKDNSQWRELQRQKAIAETEKAYSIDEKSERKKRLDDIDETFEYNASDYGRKLYIIENCIYGVDIQPIAVQIAKLRFFISLVCDQKESKERENFGIRPLPNLETKFVAANSLVGFHKPQQLFLRNPEIEKLEKELSIVRHEHFRARTPQTKEKRRIEDKEIREKIGQLLINDGWKDTTARLLANWNPYDQNTSATFFDSEWMFGLTNGFSLIIGNPPYVRADNPAIAGQREIILGSKQYETLWEKWDLMVPFFERGLKSLEPSGILTFIVSNSINTSKYAEKLQDWIIKNHFVRSIDYFENVEVFEAGVVPVILSLQALRKETYTKKIYRTNHFNNAELVMLDNDTESLKSKVFRKSFSDIFTPEIISERLGDVCYLSVGMVTNADETNAQGDFVKDDLISDTKDEIHCKEYVEGKNIKSYSIDKFKYIEYNTERVPDLLRRPTFRDLYIGDKILRGRVTKGTFDDTGIVCNDSIVVFKRFCDLKNTNERSISVSISKNNFDTHGSKTTAQVKKRRTELEKISEGYNLKYVLAVLNSSYAMAYLNNYRRHRLENYFYPDDFRNFPLPKIELSKQAAFAALADYMLFLRNSNAPQVFETVPNEHIAQFIETVINGCVFELYFPEHMKEKEIDILQFVEKEIQPIESKQPNEIIAAIITTYELWREHKSQVRNRLLLFASRSQDIIMKIENGK